MADIPDQANTFEESVYILGRDRQVKFNEMVQPIWWPADPARLSMYVLSPHKQIQSQARIQFIQYKNHQFDKVVVFRSGIALYEDATFMRGNVQIGDKDLLSGAGGTRTINRFLQSGENIAENRQRAVDINDSLRRSQCEHDLIIDLYNFDDRRSLDYALECRNTFNYYHFLTETLSQLARLTTVDHTGTITIHYSNKSERTGAFVMAFIQALFPNLADRVTLKRGKQSYDHVLSTFNFEHYYFFYSPADIAPIDDLAQLRKDEHKAKMPDPDTRTDVRLNSVSDNLFLLRDIAYQAVERTDYGYLPKRFFVARAQKPGQRDRKLNAQDDLIAALRPFGVETVYFENLSPLEQIAIMQHAELVIFVHGAGGANILFANEHAKVIEIGTIQTLKYRWPDFWPHAAVSGCRYIKMVADLDNDTPLEMPNFQQESIVAPRITSQNITDIANLVGTVLGFDTHFDNTDHLQQTCNILLETGFADKAADLLARHSDLVGTDADLLRVYANCRRDMGHYEVAFDLFKQSLALREDPDVLRQTIHLARRLKHQTYLKSALYDLLTKFPENYVDFVKSRPALQSKLASLSDIGVDHAFCIAVHHNAGLTWMFRIFKKVASTLNIPLFFCPGSDSYDVLKSRIAGNKYCFVLSLSSDFPAEFLADPNVSGLHVIRNPMDILVSGLDYHLTHTQTKNSLEPFLHNPRHDLNGETYQGHLRSLPTRSDQLRFEMREKHAETVAEMRRWSYAHKQIMELRYETLDPADLSELVKKALAPLSLTQEDMRACEDIVASLPKLAGTSTPDESIAPLADDFRAEYLDHFGADLTALGYPHPD